MNAKTSLLIFGVISFASCKTTASRSRVQEDLAQQNSVPAAAASPSKVAEILLYGKTAGSKIELKDANRNTLATVACTDDDPSINPPDRGQGLAWVCKDSKYEFQLAILEAFGQNTGLLNVSGRTQSMLFGCVPYAATGSTDGIPSIVCSNPKPATGSPGVVPPPSTQPVQPRCTGVYDFGTYKEYFSLFIDSLSSTKASLHLSAPELGYSEVLALKCVERAGWPSAAVCRDNGTGLGSFQVIYDGDAVVNIFNGPNHAGKLLDLVCH